MRKIEVRVKNRPDLVVRTRREMLRRSPDREMDEIVAANLIVPRTINELDISATELRERVRANRPIRYLVPDPVASYIEKHRLYLE